MDLHGPPERGGEAGSSRTAAVDGEAARGRRRLGERLFLASLAGDSGSWLLLHVEGLWRCGSLAWSATMVDRGGRRREAEQRPRGGRERGGNST
jgi:hypothetical protein